ncbi:hypothetical protein JRO89_XS01G0343800 [Xanthoceras sorbifolium]|uniref:O-methyltransferase C-terminal domain-containing protein n=1 Tax=Xanthoceras sorbifolium TaxID=99658 RepID=A0ABQ8INE7_9ROSI|nr:hypothetical protein JRO89_XS01G0343800 [Xanthoceras sorbifolium]
MLFLKEEFHLIESTECTHLSILGWFNEVFNKAMHNTNVIKNILEVYKGFEMVKQLVDVGGGLGVTLEAITAKYRHIKGINFDLPHVIQHATHYPDDGKLIVVEAILPVVSPEIDAATKATYQIDVLMMTQNPGHGLGHRSWI